MAGKERRKVPPAEELYGKMLEAYKSIYGAVGKWHLERKINAHKKHGLNREEAIRKVAADEGHINNKYFTKFAWSKILSKKVLWLIALVIIASIVVPYSLLSLFSAGAYGKTIIRNTSNVEEANALTIAENINYSDIFDLQRFKTSKFSEDWPYAWANFIDAKVIEYYNYRFENLKVKPRSIMKPLHIKFHYEANVFTREQIRVVYVPDTLRVLSPNGSVLFESSDCTKPWGIPCACRNDSKYQRIGAEEINVSLSKSYVIEMELEYDEAWGPVAGFYARVYQFIIVDEDFEPLLLCIEPVQYIS